MTFFDSSKMQRLSSIRPFSPLPPLPANSVRVAPYVAPLLQIRRHPLNPSPPSFTERSSENFLSLPAFSMNSLLPPGAKFFPSFFPTPPLSTPKFSFGSLVDRVSSGLATNMCDLAVMPPRSSGLVPRADRSIRLHAPLRHAFYCCFCLPTRSQPPCRLSPSLRSLL